MAKTEAAGVETVEPETESKRERKAREALKDSESSSLGTSDSPLNEKPRRKYTKRRKTAEDISPEQREALRESVRNLFQAVRTLRSTTATPLEKDQAVEDYLWTSAELLALKHAAVIIEYQEEVNFGCALGLWSGRGTYKFVANMMDNRKKKGGTGFPGISADMLGQAAAAAAKAMSGGNPPPETGGNGKPE